MGEYELLEKIKSLFGAQDMTVGSPTVSIIKFAIPLLIGNFAQQLYNTVDAIIVGQNIGDSALAAVGASNPIINLLLALFMGISAGAGIIVSQYFGAKQRENLSTSGRRVPTIGIMWPSVPRKPVCPSIWSTRSIKFVSAFGSTATKSCTILWPREKMKSKHCWASVLNGTDWTAKRLPISRHILKGWILRSRTTIRS